MVRALLSRLFGRRDPVGEAAAALHAAVVAQARRPVFYTALGVPDTLDGRFELLVLHAFLILNRLKGQGADAAAQRFYEAVVDGFDVAFREEGIGDTGVSRRVKTMVKGMHARLHAYDRALGDRKALEVALDNNLYGTVHDVPAERLDAMARYVQTCAETLGAQPLETLLAGQAAFADPAALDVGGATATPST